MHLRVEWHAGNNSQSYLVYLEKGSGRMQTRFCLEMFPVLPSVGSSMETLLDVRRADANQYAQDLAGILGCGVTPIA